LKEFDKDKYFSREGEKAKGLLLKGVCRIYYLDDNGNEWNKHFLQKNNFIASSISLEKHSITNIQALTDTEMIFLSLPKLLELSKKTQ
jgi:CRP-like cAMP-binding protein